MSRERGYSIVRLAIVVGVFALLLGACAAPATVAPPDVPQSGPQNNPEPVVINFFEDLGKALNDPRLADGDRRTYWVEQLAGYFAPNERDDQRLALRDALGSFAQDLAQLEKGETLTIEMRGFQQGQSTLSSDGTRATVELPEATISMLITQDGADGPVTVYEQPIALSRVIGNATNSVPLVQIGGRWYLTEG